MWFEVCSISLEKKPLLIGTTGDLIKFDEYYYRYVRIYGLYFILIDNRTPPVKA